jgi:MIP family channel proteins
MGTFALVFIGAGSAAVGYGGLCGIALAHGMVLALMIACLAPVSGAHFNPAVSLMFWTQKKIDDQTLGYYIGAQLTASLCAALLLSIMLAGTAFDIGSTRVNDSLSLFQGFLVEVVLTFFLAWTVLSTASKPWAPVAIGTCLTVCILFGGPLTGASLNPARSLGPCLLSGNWSELWVYLSAPLLGAWLASLVMPWMPYEHE